MTPTELVYRLLRLAGVVSLSRRRRAHGVVFCYHNVVADSESLPNNNGLHMRQSHFERQVEWIASHFDVIPLRELVDRVAARQSVRGVAALTFDDAYRGFFTHALGALRALRLPATVFVVSDAAAAPAGFWWDYPATRDDGDGSRRDRWLRTLQGDARRILDEVGATPNWQPPADLLPADWNVIRAGCGSDLDVGVHSASHRVLPALSDDDLNGEVVESLERVRAATARAVELFSYPYGWWDARVQRAVRNAGYAGAVTLDPGFNTGGCDPWRLRRINVPARIGDAAFEAWTSGLPLRVAFP